MKKEVNSAYRQARKLSLSKRTISNLNVFEMSKLLGAGHGGGGYEHTKNCTVNQNTCPGHNTCYTC